MRVARQNRVEICVATPNEGPLQFYESRIHSIQRIAHPQPQVCRNLIISTLLLEIMEALKLSFPPPDPELSALVIT